MHRLARSRTLTALLRRPDTLLCGVGVHADVQLLHGGAAATCATAVDVAVAAARYGVRKAGPGPTGLVKLVALLGGPRLQKPRHITLSNWELAPLSDAQVQYAALDAYASGWAAAALHATVCAAAARKAAPPPPPLREWLTAEAVRQACEREARRVRR